MQSLYVKNLNRIKKEFLSVHHVGGMISHVEVVSKNKNSLILRDIEHDFTFERTFSHLMDCEIEEFDSL